METNSFYDDDHRLSDGRLLWGSSMDRSKDASISSVRVDLEEADLSFSRKLLKQMRDQTRIPQIKKPLGAPKRLFLRAMPLIVNQSFGLCFAHASGHKFGYQSQFCFGLSFGLSFGKFS